MKLTRTLLKLSLAFALLASGCFNAAKKQQARADFLKEHPNYKIIWIGEPDGNETTFVTMHIEYKKPGDEREYWSDWSYDTKDGKFVFAGKGFENISPEKAQP